MNLFDLDLPAGRPWIRVRDAYEVTRKPAGLDLLSMAEVPFATMRQSHRVARTHPTTPSGRRAKSRRAPTSSVVTFS